MTSDLEAAAILELLGPARPSLHLVVVDEAGSTNQELLTLANQGAGSGYCLVARHQTAGRGRQGRRWLSDGSGSLTFSLLWHFAQGPGQLGGLSLAVSVALARALEQLGVDGIALKWPNDLLRHGRKSAGILCETTSRPRSQDVAAVIGIGINVVFDERLADCLRSPANDLRDATGLAPGRNTVLASVLRELVPVLGRFSESGFSGFRQEWMERSIHRDRLVRLTLPDHRVEVGECAGLTPDGALLLRQQNRVTSFHAGELSLRMA